MKIDLDAPGRIPGHEIMQTIRTSFPVQDWVRISINVADKNFLLGEIGAPARMMHMLTDLEDGGTISIEIPDDIDFDIDSTHKKLTATLTEWERGIKGLHEAVKTQD